MKKQNPVFQNIHRERILPQAFTIISKYAYLNIDKQLTDKKLTYVGYNVLGVVYQKPAASQDQIAQALAIDKSQCAKIIAQEEKSGYLTRKKDKEDHRMYHVNLTESGTAAIESLLEIVYQWQTKVLSILDEEDRKKFVDSVVKIEAKAKELAYQEEA